VEKKSISQILVAADSFQEAYDNFMEFFFIYMAYFEIYTIQETAILDVYEADLAGKKED
ncbi:MAG: DUF4494 family protein, partial [Duncaniella sp.]|nr:DUF4494 family protein [Duncaniella sp.]